MNIKEIFDKDPIKFMGTAIVSLMLLIFIIWIVKPDTQQTQTISKPFESGDIVYLKLDSTKLVISYELGMFDEKNFAYRATYKEGEKIVGKFVLSSELLKD